MQPNGLSLARQFFDSQQLNFPFVPEDQKEQIQYLDPGVFGTEEVDSSLYDLPKYLKSALSEKVHNFVVFGFAGHGIGSHAMHYYAVNDHLALFFQKGFGNVGRDPDDERFNVNGLFESAKHFFKYMNEAVEADKIPEGKRLFVVISDFYPEGSGWGWVQGTPGEVFEEDWSNTHDFLKAMGAIPLP